MKKYNRNIRVAVHNLNQEFLNHFSYNFVRSKIVWNRKNNNPLEIALNEWPQNKVLKIVFVIPFLLFVILTFIPALILLVLLHYIKRENSEQFQEKYFHFLHWLAKVDKVSYRNGGFNLADSFTQKPLYDGLLRVLFIDSRNEDILLKIDIKRIGEFIDEVWVYDSIEKVISEIVRQDFDLGSSFISSCNEENNYCSIEWLTEHNSKIKAERERLETNRKLVEQANQLKHPRITLRPNNFLNNNVVFYFESEYNKIVNDFLLKNYEYINGELNKKSMHLIYIPKNLSDINFDSSNLVAYASYLHPEVFSFQENERIGLLNSIFNNVDIASFYKGIAQALNIPEMQYPVFLHSVELNTGINPYRNYSYSVYQLKGADENTLKIEIEYYLRVVSFAQDPCYRLVEPDYEDPDEMFPFHGGAINQDIKKIIDSLIEFRNEKVLLSSIVYIINSLKGSQPELCNNINKILHETVSKKKTILSRLYIDEHYKIYLPDYNNIEIELTPLPKTLYIFLLKNPEGVRLKELSNHRDELIEIYSKVGNRLDMIQVKKSINDLIDARSNSINEKCSRIKEAFLSKIDESIAQHYYITGNRSENKRIILDRSLVIFSQTK